MRSTTFKQPWLSVWIVSLSAAKAFSQGFLAVDQASGTTDELMQVFTAIPDNLIAQSFTPLIPAVGFVQLQTVIFSSGETLVINLRQGAYNGPIVSSTTPVLLVNKLIEISTFYFRADVPVTPGQMYFFEPMLLSTGPLDVGYKNPSSYLRGDAWNNGLQDTGDYWFREGLVVPEPGNVWLLVLGMGALLWLRRVRREL